ncbi:MAG: fibronectin type III domain-containing protein, partial [Bacteroidaceae bacterium]|nr:fibronectin type III domain-containing protein [Bacteroidaceae bacterium]
TIHHCLWADNKSRNPKMKCYLQYYNNVVYNYAMGIIGGHSAADNYQDVMNNYFIAGPEGSAKYFDDWTATDHLYSEGNYFDGNRDGVLNGTLITDHHNATAMSKPNFNTTHPMNVETAEKAFYTIMDHVGASRVRDSHDKRIMEQLTSLGTKGNFIASEDNVGGIGTVANGPKPQDTDNDGMPDEWEVANGLNVNLNDANEYTLGGGYTNIEHYVNSLAVKSSYLMYPLNPEATLLTATAVKLTWMNSEKENAVAIVVEQSEDNRTFTEVRRLQSSATQTTITGLTADKVYFFRLKTIGNDGLESLYSATVSVNDEFMRPGGGTRASVDPFVPTDGKLYRIISYATIPYNSGTTLQGAPKYLTFNANGTLGTTENYQWDDPSLLWVITPVEGGVNIRNYGDKKYIAARNSSIDGAERIGSSTAPTVLTINYTGNQQPSQSGLYGQVSMYRINSPSNNNQQIRARGFVDDWIWGSGTFDRADMVFTFVEIDASHVRIFLTKFNTTLESAMQLAKGAQTDVTLGYPSAALNKLMDAIASAQAFESGISEKTTQEEINAQVSALSNAINTFNNSRIYTFEGFSTDLSYIIYSYGTHPNASAATADGGVERRYLYAVKSADGQRDSLVYRIGLTENVIATGRRDPLASNPAALWSFKDAGNGMVYVRNQACGAYMRIERLLSSTPVAIRPYYAKQDNGKMAFYMDADTNGKRLFNVGNADADGKGGPLEFFTAHADRTRLRWVIEATDIEITDAIRQPSAVTITPAAQYYDLQGRALATPPPHGVFLMRTRDSKGQTQVVKVMR